MIPLTVLPNDGGSRIKRDRLELMAALIEAPGFDPIYRADLIKIPRDHPVYGWGCTVAGCTRVRRVGVLLCESHTAQWTIAKATNATTMAEFCRTATPLTPALGLDVGTCRICPDRPVSHHPTGLCEYHRSTWEHLKTSKPAVADFTSWLSDQTPLAGFGPCTVTVCRDLACSPLRLCDMHRDRYRREGSPGGARLPVRWSRRRDLRGLPIPIVCDDEAAFQHWRVNADPVYRLGVLNLVALPPLLRAEFQWGLHAHAQMASRSAWDLASLQRLVNQVRRLRLTSLIELDTTNSSNAAVRKQIDSHGRSISYQIICGLRCIYYSPHDTREAGYIETDHFGRRFPARQSHFDLTKRLPTVAARHALGQPRRAAEFRELSTQRQPAGVPAPGLHRAERLPGDRRAPRRTRSHAAARGARPALRRRPATPSATRHQLPRRDPPRRLHQHRHRRHPPGRLPVRAEAALHRAGVRSRRTDRPGPRVHHRDPVRHGTARAFTKPFSRRTGARTRRRGQPPPVRRHLRPERPRPAGYLGSHRAHRPSLQ